MPSAENSPQFRTRFPNGRVAPRQPTAPASEQTSAGTPPAEATPVILSKPTNRGPFDRVQRPPDGPGPVPAGLVSPQRTL